MIASILAGGTNALDKYRHPTNDVYENPPGLSVAALLNRKGCQRVALSDRRSRQDAWVSRSGDPGKTDCAGVDRVLDSAHSRPSSVDQFELLIR
jgi:hypothetical protein